MKPKERDELLVRVDQSLQDLKPLVTDHEKRIRRNEKVIVGAQAVWGAIAAYVVYLKKGG
jgi:hypothetical protein